MSYSIKIGKHSIELAGYAGKVVAPNTQMETLFRGMAGELTNLRVTAQQAEAEADLLDVIRNDPDLNEQAKIAGQVKPATLTRLRPLLAEWLPLVARPQIFSTT